MVKQFSIRQEHRDKEVAAYQEYIDGMSAPELMAEFINYLDYTEESDSGRVFHPIQISSVRVAMTPALDMVIKEMRKRSDGYGESEQCDVCGDHDCDNPRNCETGDGV